MKILACNSNINLAESISKTLNTRLVKADVKRFSDMEVFVEVQENVRERICLLYNLLLTLQMII